MSTELWDWWENRLTRVQRDELMAAGREALHPDLAQEIQVAAGSLPIVEQTRNLDGRDEWHVSDGAARFVGDRDYELRHEKNDLSPPPVTVFSMTPARPAAVELLYTEACPNWEATAIRLSIALQVTGRDTIPVSIRRITTPEEADQTGFTGSPMIRFDGTDPFPDPGLSVGLSCRLYRDGDEIVEGPTVGQLVDALLAYDP